MYINLSVWKSSCLLPSDLIFLAAIKQTETEFLIESLTESDYERFKTLSLVEHIKSVKKSDHAYNSLRLTEKAKTFLINLSFEGAADEETETIKNWVISVYKNKSGGIVKNKTELGRRIQWFKQITEIKGNFLALLIQAAMSDTYNPDCGQSFFEYKKDNPRAMLSNLAENLFWSPSSIYDKHKTLDKSPLYTYYEDNKEHIKQIWEVNLNEDGSRKK